MKRIAVLLVLALPLVAACGSDDDSSSDTTAAAASGGEAACLSPEQGEPADEYVGLDEEAATALAEEDGLTLRVAGEDGECFPMTMDIREDRVNVEIVDGEVVTAVRF
jgi:hypothetical protein